MCTPVHTVRTVCTPVHTGANRQYYACSDLNAKMDTYQQWASTKVPTIQHEFQGFDLQTALIMHLNSVEVVVKFNTEVP